jgi:hypothetical protein
MYCDYAVQLRARESLHEREGKKKTYSVR